MSEQGPMQKIIVDCQMDLANRFERTPLILSEFYERAIGQDAQLADRDKTITQLVAALEGLDAVIHFDMPWHDDYGLRLRPAAMDAAMKQARAAITGAKEGAR